MLWKCLFSVGSTHLRWQKLPLTYPSGASAGEVSREAAGLKQVSIVYLNLHKCSHVFFTRNIFSRWYFPWVLYALIVPFLCAQEKIQALLMLFFKKE
jgi:hypothetical protein